MTLKREKCLFRADQVVFMGLLLAKYGAGPTEEKVRAVRETQTPANVSQVRSFSGPGRLHFPGFCPTLLLQVSRCGSLPVWGRNCTGGQRKTRHLTL